jgi:putative DNA primase/helicase
MRQKDILKEILDNLPKVDFKEIYAKELYQRLAKETDSDMKNLLQYKLFSIQITDEIKAVLVSERVREVAYGLGYGLVINEGKVAYLYNKVCWEQINELDLKHFLGSGQVYGQKCEDSEQDL